MDIDIRIVGEDYLGRDFTGKEYCQNNNIKIYYNNRKHDYSTTSLIARIKKS